ncbi:hypothetical protein [Bythopirellula goksoeyrii]|uniref:hypothetical protein n=1 Tax=Bythopirellula goksoeyrii TaxID=1400387 RepID=UPI0011CEB032|nr:hypothetical protein [Bythopirellula goksoeyrii]
MLARCLSACVVASLCSQVFAAGNLDDNNLRNDLVYDSTSGNVQLEVPDFVATGPVVQFSLGTDQAFNLDDGFVTQGLDCGLILPAVACGNEQAISYDDPTNLGFQGVFELGRILPAGFSGPQVQSFLNEASYRTSGIPTLTEFDIFVVPEPSTLIEFLLVVFSLIAVRQPYSRS